MLNPAAVLHRHKLIELLAKIPLRIAEDSGSFSLISETGEVLFENEKGLTASFGLLENLTSDQVSRLYDLALAQNLLLRKPPLVGTTP